MRQQQTRQTMTFDELMAAVRAAVGGDGPDADPAEWLADASVDFFAQVAATGADGFQSLQVVDVEGEKELWACYAARLPLETADELADLLTTTEDRKKAMLQILTSTYAATALLQRVFPGVGEKTFTFDNRRTP